MVAFKKVVLDVVLVILLFIISLMLETVIKIQNPDCVTCGANMSITFWLASVAALQPALWATGINKIPRILIWLVAVCIGAIAYIVLEFIAGLLFFSGIASALSLGVFANIGFSLLAFISSLIGVRIIKRKSSAASSIQKVESGQSAENGKV